MKVYRLRDGALQGGASLADHLAAQGLADVVFAVDMAANTVTVENVDDDNTARRDKVRAAVQSFTGAPRPDPAAARRRDGFAKARASVDGGDVAAAMRALLDVLDPPASSPAR